MKIQCDVCNRDVASVFCYADEAALCDACDGRVHHANKLAGKHQRFPLLHPSAAPLCDICQERRALLFCQQDRAILCRDCDISIHSANQFTQNHDRFLLTGVKLSPTTLVTAESSHDNTSDSYPANKSKSTKRPVASAEISSSSQPTVNEVGVTNHNLMTSEAGSTSSISEYLIEMLPGWKVDDFLDSSNYPSHGYRKNEDDNEISPFLNSDFVNSLDSFSAESSGIWVPQAPPPPPLHTSSQYSYSSFPDMAMGTGQIGLMKNFKEAASTVKSTRRWSEDALLTVPQISPPSTSSKRSRPF
ncbi:B-box zinc finger protein 21-like [Malania oleifera]|uniref:B-box zinc finger protein 21-like n=1 Tax=Malania oleifera TaxID=397392 RepID=UPI0025AE352C|nr:B-box zinc finger protein 21-like [Malania oleifera]